MRPKLDNGLMEMAHVFEAVKRRAMRQITAKLPCTFIFPMLAGAASAGDCLRLCDDEILEDTTNAE